MAIIINFGCSEPSGVVTKEASVPDISDLSISEDLREIFSKRRCRMMDQVEEGIVIMSSGAFPSGDHCEYRVNDNFFWITGFDQPMSVVVIKKNYPDSVILFLRERNRRDIIYNGGEQRNEEIIAGYGFATILPYSELGGLIAGRISSGTPVYSDFRDRMLRGSLLAEAVKQRKPETLIRDISPVTVSMRNYLDGNLPGPAEHNIYFDCGTATLDALYEPHQLLVDEIMATKGFTSENWITKKFNGEDHSELSWSKRLDIPLTFLLGLKQQ